MLVEKNTTVSRDLTPIVPRVPAIPNSIDYRHRIQLKGNAMQVVWFRKLNCCDETKSFAFHNIFRTLRHVLQRIYHPPYARQALIPNGHHHKGEHPRWVSRCLLSEDFRSCCDHQPGLQSFNDACFGKYTAFDTHLLRHKRDSPLPWRVKSLFWNTSSFLALHRWNIWFGLQQCGVFGVWGCKFSNFVEKLLVCVCLSLKKWFCFEKISRFFLWIFKKI
jgi:hypothetical protein